MVELGCPAEHETLTDPATVLPIGEVRRRRWPQRQRATERTSLAPPGAVGGPLCSRVARRPPAAAVSIIARGRLLAAAAGALLST